jgi:hypothetical protein
MVPDASTPRFASACKDSQQHARQGRAQTLALAAWQPDDEVDGIGGIDAKTLSFFSACPAGSIDFSQFAPMFRLDAARYRNAIS